MSGATKSASGGRFVGLVARHAFLAIICVAALYPLWFIVSTAMKSNAAYQLDPTGFPTHPTFESLPASCVEYFENSRRPPLWPDRLGARS